MIRDSNHELCQPQFGSPVIEGNRMWFHLSSVQAEISTVALLHDGLAAACESEASPSAAQRTLTECPRRTVISPEGDAQFSGALERRHAFDILADQAHTCQKGQ